MSEWEVVTNKKKKKKSYATNNKVHKRNHLVVLDNDNKDNNEDEEEDISSIITELITIQQLIRTTILYDKSLSSLQSSLLNNNNNNNNISKKFSRIILLGLGHFCQSNSLSSLLQLGLILELIKEESLFDIVNKEDEKNEMNMFIYDPIMSINDKKLCSLLGISVIVNDKIHLRPVVDMDDMNKTLFYMPHCPYLLYNHIIWTNWKPSCLMNIVIFGNSFESYRLRHIDKSCSRWDCIELLSDIISEINVWDSKICQKLIKLSSSLSSSSQRHVSFMESAFNDMRLVI